MNHSSSETTPVTQGQDIDQQDHHAPSLKIWMANNHGCFGKIPRRLTRRNPLMLALIAVLLFIIHHRRGAAYLETHVRSKSPFSGALSVFPALSHMPKRQRRITIVSVWNDGNYKEWLRHFLYTIQLNAENVDLLLINRLITPGATCLDLAGNGVDISWAGNVKFHCLTNDDWKRYHANFVCSKDYGWDCTPTQYSEVLEEYYKREDAQNYSWRVLRGYIFRDLFIRPDNPFWAWMDLDTFMGDFGRYPFNLLSKVSLVTGSHGSPGLLWMAGQFTAMNMADKALAVAWKKFPEMQSADHFTKYLQGKMPESTEEGYWSAGYFRSGPDDAGSELSWVSYPEMNADDFFDGQFETRNASQTSIISGKDVFVASSSYGREELERVVLYERALPVDDLGGIGWTSGKDRSTLLKHAANVLDSSRTGAYTDELPIETDCTAKKRRWRQCIAMHPSALTNPPLMRQSAMHLKSTRPGYALRRLEPDTRTRGHDRRLLRHFLSCKKNSWFQLPPFEITPDLIMKVDCDSIQVWRMGDYRQIDLYYRAADQ